MRALEGVRETEREREADTGRDPFELEGRETTGEGPDPGLRGDEVGTDNGANRAALAGRDREGVDE